MLPARRALAALLVLVPTLAHAQHADHPPLRLPDQVGIIDPPDVGIVEVAFTSALAPHRPMTDDGSGTGWLPASSPMEMAMVVPPNGRWVFGLHGAVFPRVTAQDAGEAGSRGATSVDAPNWLMGMAQRPLGTATRLTVRAMLSLDPITEGGNGYPLLFQTGETFEGARLVDRQHPHDAVSELSATLARSLGSDASAFAYAAYPGEPALGPVAFMHRPSARFMADAPLSHHWQDATHILWGVATAGVVVGPVKLDGSVFTGAEPDEDRWTPDTPSFNSVSARVSVSPSPAWALQVSRGWLTEPEALEPGVDQTRTTASVIYGSRLGPGDVTATLAWGRNVFHTEDEADDHGDPQDAFLAEAAYQFGRFGVFGRGEVVDKSTEELALDDALGEAVYSVGALSLGGVAEVARLGGLVARVGLQGTAYAVPDGLAPLYGSAPVSAQVFLRLSPSRMMHGGRDPAMPGRDHSGHEM